ncbi:VWA domain-containing protein [Phytohabitans sp. ZYX-F-186]|uniref:VWA domain-containing protein n=1 Tax=Phytohabitans maris TaxID=3071409 RepID=A0ABU0Z9V7_9ACTN|nr:VWA domain-containing protein [Phytohabitans sp. ZYX-F-186]MDQ7903841.1 VWA domain-containing protein [Phytohabitans sp. ZYX-F-186]
MSFRHPLLLAVAVAVGVGLLVAYQLLQRRRATALAAAGLQPAHPRRGRLRRHLPPLLMLAALVLLFLGVARPQATVPVPRASGTVILAFDVSNSMAAKDVAPTRLGAAQSAAAAFVRSQPDTVDVGIVAFGQGALTTQLPGNDHASTVAAINRLTVAGGTSLGQAILASLSAIVGQPVSLPDPEAAEPAPDLGYWRSATIVLLSDGEDTGGPDALAAAELAATAGVHIETVGVGTVEGATIEVEGYQMATALNEELLTQVAEATAGSYHRAQDARSLDDVYDTLDLRISTEDKLVELTGAAVGIGLLLLTIGGLLMITWFGRIL